VLKGTLDDFSLPDIFRLTSHAKKTGRLDVERRNGSGRVYFREGEVYYAESTKSREPLGQKLIRSGWITEEQLRHAVETSVKTTQRVGEVLVEQGSAEEAQVEWAVRSQIEDGVFDLLRWDLGAFAWEPDVAIEVEVPLTVTVENLIIEASRRLDEIAEIRKIIPSAEVVLAMAPKPPAGSHQVNITSEEWQVLVLVDGFRSVADIATHTGADAYQTMRLLFGLMNAGLIINTEPDARGSEGEQTRRKRESIRLTEDAVGSEQDGSGANVVALQTDDGVTAQEPPAPPPVDRPRSEDLDDEPGASEASEAEEASSPPAPPPAPSGEPAPRVDRATVVRELAGLFSDEDKPRPRAVPTEGRPPPSGGNKRRVEDDDQIDGKTIDRMIDGVKGL